MQSEGASDSLVDGMIHCFMRHAQELEDLDTVEEAAAVAMSRVQSHISNELSSLVRARLDDCMHPGNGSSNNSSSGIEDLASTVATTLHVVLATLGGDVWSQPVINCISTMFKEHAVTGDGSRLLPSSSETAEEMENDSTSPIATPQPANAPHQHSALFAYQLVVHFLRGMNYRGNEFREELLASLFAACALPPALKTEVLARWKIRRNQLLCKSVAPRCALQVPSTTSHLVQLMHTFMSGHDATPSNDPDWSANVDPAWVRVLQGEMYDALAASCIHHRFLAVVVLRAVVAYHHREMTAPPSSAPSSLGVIRIRPPLCALFDDKGGLLRLLVETLQETAVNVFCDALPEDAAAARRAPLLLFAHGFFTVHTAMACYFGALLHGPSPAVVDASQAATANFEGCLQRAAKFSMELDAYVAGTSYESALDTTLFGNNNGGGGRGGGGAAAAKRVNANGVTMNGDLPQTSFFRVVHKTPAPSWNDLLSKAEARAIPWRTFPISLLQELLALRLYDAAAQYIVEARGLLHVDVFVYRGDAIDGNEAHARIVDHIDGRLQGIQSAAVGGEGAAAASWTVATVLRRTICDMMPLLKAAQSYLGSVRFLWTLMRSAVTAWAEPSAAMGPLRELLVYVVLPCFRVVVPSPPLYHLMHQLFECMQMRATDERSEFLSAKELLTAGIVPRMPHDALHFKALDIAFNSSIKRMTLETVPEYMAASMGMLYSNPIHVIEKLFQQAIGYENAQATTHAQLLAAAPQPILKMFLVIGLNLMRRYAAEERDGAENRVAIVASFICIVWRVNPATFDGAFALREVERSYRRPARESLVFGNEFLKAALLQLTNTVCEYEEQYNPEQLASLGCVGTTSTWFGRGAAASFLGRWHPRLFNAEILEQSRNTLRSALNSPLLQPHSLGEAHPPPTGPVTSIGKAILLHLASLDCNVYDILGDISGTMESVLNQCAKQHNILNDVMFSLAPMVDAPPTIEELGLVTLPAIALKLTALAARRRAAASVASEADPTLIQSFKKYFLEPTSSASGNEEETPKQGEGGAPADDSDDVISASIQCTLGGLQSYHFEYNAATYVKAKSEADAVVRRAQLDSAASKAAKGMLAASRTWAASQVNLIETERSMHEAVHAESASFVDAFLRTCVLPSVVREPLGFVRRCIVPRALLSLEDAIAMAAFLRSLLRCAASSSDAEHRRVVDLLLLVVSTILAMFVSLTDGECKRCGSLIAAILQMLDDDVECARRKDVAAVGGGASNLASPQQLLSPVAGTPPSTCNAGVTNGAAGTAGSITNNGAACELLERSRTFVGALQATCLDAWIPAYILDCDAYLAQAFYQILSGAPKDVPQFCFRNAFIILDRIKTSFPRTPEAAAVMLAAVRYHNDKSSAYFAAATAQMKLYLSVIALQKGNVSGSYMKQLLADLNEAISRETDLAASTAAEIGALDAAEEQVAQQQAGVEEDDEVQMRQREGSNRSVQSDVEDGGSDRGDDMDDNCSVAASNVSGSSGSDSSSSDRPSDEDDDDIAVDESTAASDEQARGNKRPRDEEGLSPEMKSGGDAHNGEEQ